MPLGGCLAPGVSARLQGVWEQPCPQFHIGHFQPRRPHDQGQVEGPQVCRAGPCWALQGTTPSPKQVECRLRWSISASVTEREGHPVRESVAQHGTRPLPRRWFWAPPSLSGLLGEAGRTQHTRGVPGLQAPRGLPSSGAHSARSAPIAGDPDGVNLGRAFPRRPLPTARDPSSRPASCTHTQVSAVEVNRNRATPHTSS